MSRGPSHRTRRGAAALALLALGAGLLAACGIPTDGKPREISRDALPPELIDPTAQPVASDEDLQFVTLYLVNADEREGESLVAVRRAVPMPTDPAGVPRAITDALIGARPDQLGRTDLVNALPSDVQVRSAVLGDDGVLDLDLTNLGNVESALQRLAVAQLIFTLTGLDDPVVRAVRFSVDGQEVAVPIEAGVAAPGTPVTRADEPSLMPRPTTTTSSSTTTTTR
jgi:spore germination protein GerM